MTHGMGKMERVQVQAKAMYTTLVTVKHVLENGDWNRNIKDPLVAEDIMELRKFLAQMIDIIISPLEEDRNSGIWEPSGLSSWRRGMFIFIGIGVLVIGMVVHFFTGNYQVEDIGFGMMLGAFLAYWDNR